MEPPEEVWVSSLTDGPPQPLQLLLLLMEGALLHLGLQDLLLLHLQLTLLLQLPIPDGGEGAHLRPKPF